MLKYLLITSLVFLQISCKESTDAPVQTPPPVSPKPQAPVTEKAPQLPAFKAPAGATKEEAIALEVTHLMQAYTIGDAQTLVDSTHPAIFNKAGGEEAYKNAIRGSVKTLMKLNISIDDFVATAPNTFYPNGEQEVCFVTTKYIMTLNGKKSNVDSFMLAAGSEKSGWKFLDGAGLTIGENLLQELFPKLSRDVKLPIHKLTTIEADKAEETTDSQK